jgi:signal transduction histidine kinase
MGVELFVINLTTALCVLFFIVLVVRNGLSVSLNRRFAYFLLALLSWLIFNYLSNQTVLSYSVLLFVNRLVFVSSAIAMATMLRFCLGIRSEKITRLVDLLIWTITILSITLALTPYVVESITANGSVVGVVFGWAGDAYFASLGILALWVILRLLYDTIKAKGVAKARARALFAAFGVGLVLVAITNAVLPAFFNLFYLSAIGSLVVVVILTGVGYSIVRYKLFDIRSFVTRSLAYIFTITVLTVTYSAATVGVLSRVTGQPVSLAHEIPYFMIALFLGLTFQPMKRFFDRLSNRIFYNDHYDVQDVLNRFSDLILGEVRLNNLLDGTIGLILESLKSDYGKIVLVDKKGKAFRSSSDEESHEISIVQLVDTMKDADRDILVAEAEDISEHGKTNKALYAAVRAMQANHMQVIVRLKTSSSNSVGYILIGRKRSDGVYTNEDVQLLSLLGGELAVAIENSLRFEEIKNFSETLQDKVDSATQRLRRANAQLQRLDEVKDEFVSMASHQLRTPLTSVKGYISMVLEGDVGKISAMQRKLLSEAFTSSERMVHLISDFLNVSRLQTGKFILERRATDLAKVVAQEIESLQTTALAHNLKLQYHSPRHFPILYIDDSKIRQVLMNFIDNAIYYSEPGTVIIVKLTVEDGDAVLRVRDTGIGVPKSEQAHLFTKFFRATNARKQRPDGTGVGLFLAKKVVDAHEGTVVFESVENEGSTFGFRLPIKKLSDVPAEDTDKLNK